PYLPQAHTTHPQQHSFPTRRSSDLVEPTERRRARGDENQTHWMPVRLYQSEMESQESDVPAGRSVWPYRAKFSGRDPCKSGRPEDRKSTRLNSSHQIISYAVFCLKK